MEKCRGVEFFWQRVGAGGRSFGDRSFGDRSFGDRSFGDRSFGDRSFGDRRPETRDQRPEGGGAGAEGADGCQRSLSHARWQCFGLRPYWDFYRQSMGGTVIVLGWSTFVFVEP